MPLLDLLAAADGHPVLVIEDLHLIDSEQTLATLDWWLARLPAHCTVGLTTRTEPDLPVLQTLRACGEVVELRTTDLRFDPAKIQDLLRTGFGLNLTDDQLNAVEFATEG